VAEWDVCRLLVTGHSRTEIALSRGTGESTVSKLLSRACRKLDVCVVHGSPIDTEELAGALTDCREPEEAPLPPAQKLYLQMFDRYLKARGERAERRARLEMRYALGAIYLELQIPRPRALAA
jgi:hypothetical protein